MTSHEFDLDLPDQSAGWGGSDREPDLAERNSGADTSGPIKERARRPRAGRAIILVALALVGAATGAVLAAAPGGTSAMAPVAALLAPLSVTTTQTPTVTLRLTISNPGPQPIKVTGLNLNSGGTTTPFAIGVRVAAGAVQTADVTMQPTCLGPADTDPGSGPLGARATVADDSRPLTVLLDDSLSSRGGLCSLVDHSLPRGWRHQLKTDEPRVDGNDLILTVRGLGSQPLAGSLYTVNGVTQINVYAGDQLIPATFSANATLRLLGPAHCFEGADSVPMSISLYMYTFEGLTEVMVQAGPRLATWLTDQCPAEWRPVRIRS